jgi:hypothetical protein
MRQNDAETRLKTGPSLRYVHLCMTSDVTAAKELPRSKAGFPFNRLIVPASRPYSADYPAFATHIVHKTKKTARIRS